MTEKKIRIVLDKRGAQRGVEELDSSMTELGKSSDKTQFAVKKLAAVMAGIFAADKITNYLKSSVQSFANFEKGLISVSKTTNIVGDDLDNFGDKIREMSRELPLAATELLEIAGAAGQLGISGSANLLKFTETIAKLGMSSNLAGENAATSLARIMTVTGEAMENVDRMGATIVELGNNFAATEAEIAHVATRVAQSTAIFDVTTASVLGISTALQAVGIEAESGGTQVGLAFMAINDALRNGGKEMEALRIITGQTREELQAAFFNGESTAVFQSFVEGLGRVGASGDDVGAALESMGLSGTRAVQVLSTLSTRADVLGDAIDKANVGWNENIALNKEAAAASKSFSAQMQIVANAADEAASALGAVLAPKILDGMSTFRESAIYIAENMESIVEILKVLTVAIGARLATAVIASSIAFGKSTLEIIKNNQALAANIKQSQAIVASELSAAQAHVASTQAVIAQMAAERELELVRLKNQISAKGRQQSMTRLGMLRRDELAMATQLTAAEARLATAQAASTQAANAKATSLVRLTGATRALRGATALLGGPMGIFLIAASSLAYYATKADEATDANNILAKSVDNLTKNQLALDNLNTTKAIEKQKEEIEDLEDKIAKLSGEKTSYLNQMLYEGVSQKAVNEELIEYKAKLDDSTESLKKLEQRLSQVNNMMSGQTVEALNEADYGKFNGDDVFDDISPEATPKASGDLGGLEETEFNPLPGLQQGTAAMERELKLRQNISAIYRSAELDAMSSQFEQERALQLAQEEEEIARLEAKRAEDEAQRLVRLTEMLEKMGEDHILKTEVKMEFENQEKLSAQLLQEQITAIEAKGAQDREKIAQQEANTKISTWAGMASSGLKLISSFGKQSFQSQKNFAIADSIISITAGVAQALNNPYPANLGFAASVAAQGAGLLSTIRSTNPNGGGSISSGAVGGGQPHGMDSLQRSTAVQETRDFGVIKIEGLDDESLYSGAAVKKMQKALEENWKSGDGIGRIIYA